MTKISVSLSTKSINAAIREVERYRSELRQKAILIAQRLANLGYDVAKVIMGGHVYTGEMINSLHVEDSGGGKVALVAEGKAILFFEFGAGARYGYGHPLDSELGVGPGTYPGKGHWDNPHGWWYPTDDARLIQKTDKNGQGWAHSYGNPPHMPMYRASVVIMQNIERIAIEVFQNGKG